MPKWEAVDSGALGVLRIDAVAKVENAVSEIAGHYVTGGRDDCLLQCVEAG